MRPIVLTSCSGSCSGRVAQRSFVCGHGRVGYGSPRAIAAHSHPPGCSSEHIAGTASALCGSRLAISLRLAVTVLYQRDYRVLFENHSQREQCETGEHRTSSDSAAPQSPSWRADAAPLAERVISRVLLYLFCT